MSAYKKLTQREHILLRSGMYIGSMDRVKEARWIYNSEKGEMEWKEVAISPGFLKIFDEILVNALDHRTRQLGLAASVPDAVPVKHIDVTITPGRITVKNDGDGIPVVKHESGMWIPQMIFGELLTSSNYDESEEKIVGGTNGLGGKLCSVFSTEYSVTTVDHRSKKKYAQTWRANMSVCEVPKITASAVKPYTEVTFVPDLPRFGITEGVIPTDSMSVLATRVVDAAMSAGKDCRVTLNGVALVATDFPKYMKLYLTDDGVASGAGGAGADGKRIAYERAGDRWEIGAMLTRDLHGEAPPDQRHISFVNGIYTRKGGKHVEYVLQKVLAAFCEYAKKKAKLEITPGLLKESMVLFLNATIVNPAFDTQTKETLTTPSSKFGSLPTISDKFITALGTIGLLDEARILLEAKTKKDAKRTDGKKRSTVRGIPKLEDAVWAGGARSADCTLILTEGDSAATTAISGLKVIGREQYGVFPLKGKILNVKDISAAKRLANEELTNINKILGLETGKIYKSLSELRYGRIMIMTDQDVDGSHIKGLLMNLFHTDWSSLLKLGFLCCMMTPLLKATKGATTLSFYSESEYEAWKAVNDSRGWKTKYYKGLGTSTAEEAREYFRTMNTVRYDWEEKKTDEAIDLAFNKGRADDRKTWLATFHRERHLEVAPGGSVGYSRFVNDELIHFSVADNVRSLPHVMDGLKPSQRKILWSALKRNLVSEIRVAQLAGYVSETAAYHHGEVSLHGAIIGMAQTFVGSNNLNLLVPNGQFGCLAPDTPILMWNGTNKLAKDIIIGDTLIGDDGLQRTVLRITSGIDTMYEIMDNCGKSLTVNSQHILTLYYRENFIIKWKDSAEIWYFMCFNGTSIEQYNVGVNTNLSKEDHFNRSKLTKSEGYKLILKKQTEMKKLYSSSHIIDIKVTDYLRLSTFARRGMYMISNINNINWNKKDVPIDPYLLGAWLGDGDQAGKGFTTSDIEIKELYESCVKGHRNPFTQLLRNNKLFMNKHIPIDYMINDKETRLQLLAGFIDTDGTIKHNNTARACIEISQSKRLHEGLILSAEFIAKSLGYATSIYHSREGRLTKKGEDTHLLTLRIFGSNIHEIPTRIPRKKIIITDDRIKHTIHYTSFKVTSIGMGPFNGWSIDGNERFLLGNFVVTHNSRLLGGSDAASPRYIHTALEPIVRTLVRKEDDPILKRMDDDGLLVEPETYLPVVPLLLVNGALGIGTGYSTTVPPYNPADLVAALRAKLAGSAVPALSPWWFGFRGSVTKPAEHTYVTRGLYEFTNEETHTIRIKELPVGCWTKHYKEFLEEMLVKQEEEKKGGTAAKKGGAGGAAAAPMAHLKSFEEAYNDIDVDFILHMEPDGYHEAKRYPEEFEKRFKMTTTFKTSNLVAFDVTGAIRKFATVQEILETFYTTRLDGYRRRKAYQLEELARQLVELNAKYVFVLAIVEKRLVVTNVTDEELLAGLVALKLPPLSEGMGLKGFEYLLRMRIDRLKAASVAELAAEVADVTATRDRLAATAPETIWSAELDAFAAAWDTYSKERTATYTVAASAPVKKKRAAPKAKAGAGAALSAVLVHE